MIDYIASILVRFLNKILHVVPIESSLWLGRRLGSAAFFFNKKRRLIAYANLKAAFAVEKSPAELREITKGVYQNLLQTFVEILSLTKINKSYVAKYVEIVNRERINNASKSGRGTILLTGHFGDWELSSLTSAVIGFPILVLAREQKMKRMNELLNELRESKGCKVVRKGISTKNIVKALQDKEIVGILSDQDAGRDGVFVNFFGRPTSTHIGPMAIAKRTDSIILPNFIVRTHGPYHKVFLEEYIDFRETSGGDDIKEGLQRFASILESYVRKYPDQWLWLHKRWKSTPSRTVLVLSDGKAGHLSQSMAIARAIQKARATQGYRLEDTRIVTVDVKYRNRFSRPALAFCAAFASWRCHGCMRCMKACLDMGTYETLMKTYAEFVVSCGSSLGPVNIFMTKENNAKNAIVMKPGLLFGLKKFTLAIIPRHDNPPKAGNVVETELAPNLMDAERLKADGEKLQRRIGGVSAKAIGVFLGGDNPEFLLTKEVALGVIDDAIKFCEEADSDLLVTTSRRTSSEVEAALRGRLKDSPRTKLLVIANENNPEETVGGILALSEIVIVSGESVSMVSEAVSAGKKVIAFELEKRAGVRGPTKYETVLRALESGGYIKISSAGNLPQSLEAVRRKEAGVKELKDRDNIFEAVRRMI